LHLHDGASEVFYFLAGRCRLEIGDSEAFFGPGDFVLIPPEVPHNLWNAADEDLLVFWIVAPNFVNNKWRTADFPSGAMDKRAPRGHVDPGVDLPSDKNILSRLLTLGPSPYRARTAESQEAIIYVGQGEAKVTVGRLGGTLRRNEFVHVPVGTPYSIAATGAHAAAIVFEAPAG
jgi:mannose-6-phosphate isomerase-like protein (cupin superfamily)